MSIYIGSIINVGVKNKPQHFLHKKVHLSKIPDKM